MSAYNYTNYTNHSNATLDCGASNGYSALGGAIIGSFGTALAIAALPHVVAGARAGGTAIYNGGRNAYNTGYNYFYPPAPQPPAVPMQQFLPANPHHHIIQMG
jgi:hypothetical protein